MKGHLIHIGFPKTGSTFLQHWFEKHPQLLYAPGGLGGFYNVYDISRHACQNSVEYLYHVTSDESLVNPAFSTGTIPVEFGRKMTPPFLNSKLARSAVCSTLKSLYPNGKILFITRGFKGITDSGYSQYVKAGGVLDFKEHTERITAAFKDMSAKNTISEGMNFSLIISLYAEAFGKENMIVLPYELLRDDQNKFLSIIEETLGLTHSEEKIGRINQSLSPEELYWYPRISRLVSRISRFFGIRFYTIIYTWYVQKTLFNRFKKIIAILNKIKPGHLVIETDPNDAMWNYFRKYHAEDFSGKLRDFPVYTPYLADYGIDASK